MDFLDLAVTIAENLRLLIFGPLFAAIIALGISYLIPPTYTARTSFFPPQQQHSASASMLAQLGALAGVAATATGLKNPADQYVALLQSTTVADSLISRFNLMELYDKELRQDARLELEDNSRIVTGKDGLIVVEVEDKSPQRAADMANAYVSELEALMGRLALTEAQQRRAFFERQLEETRKNLAEAERSLAGVGLTPSAIKANPEVAVEGVASLQARVTAQEVKLAVLRGYLTESAPEFVQALSELSALRAQLQKAEISDPKASQSGGYIDRYRNFKYHETLFELFARQFELAKVDEAKEGAVIQIIDKALPPERKSKPKRALIAIFVSLATGFVLIVFAFVRKSLKNAKQHPDSAAKLEAVRGGLRRALKLRD
ncbi:MAG: Wzz/FepE/Etk N-terminal domain-containing protein [Candidatus Binatia bacterium]